MFSPGAKVNDLNTYINHYPYTAKATGFKENDWFIIALSSDFPLSGAVSNCLSNFYKRCIVFK
jgi:hypothetical protein